MWSSNGVGGPEPGRCVNRLVTRYLRQIAPGRVGYTLWCDEDGFVIDDGTLFRFAADDFRLCCQEPQYGWLHDVAWGFEVEISDASDEIAGLSLQGPTSFAVLEAARLGRLAGLRPFGFPAAEVVPPVSPTAFPCPLGYVLLLPISLP